MGSARCGVLAAVVFACLTAASPVVAARMLVQPFPK